MAEVRTPVTVDLKGRMVTIEIEGLDTVERALGDLRGKTPQALKVAVNQTAREARKMMIAAAKARYVVNAAGQRHLNDLKQKKKATNTNPAATLFISKMRNDLAYFENMPTTVYSGMNVRHAPQFVKARVLADSGLKDLTGKGNLSKGFLAQFKSGHIGMVQRVIGSKSSHTVTESGRPRWRNAQGNVEKLQTMGAPSATAMHTQVWPEVQEDVRYYLMARIQDRVDWILARYS
ncbi:hypothetical protein [uncultured Dysosmobacter sp.]|uniref:hypothetical protein n=1 Tax=uncultured Dysosmobacter sp. TaxID=2591384 RepID=UPI00262D341C|nr:hypothetical protein [uncultured Dysosmobacter sp.]